MFPVHKLPRLKCWGDTEQAELFLFMACLQGVGTFFLLLGFRLTLLFMGLIKPEECTHLNPSEKQVLLQLIGSRESCWSK